MPLLWQGNAYACTERGELRLPEVRPNRGWQTIEDFLVRRETLRLCRGIIAVVFITYTKEVYRAEY